MTNGVTAPRKIDSLKWIYLGSCVLIVAVAVLLRARSAMNDLGMDEIWSVELVRELHSPLEVFNKTHHDNNHYLNSLFIYFLGQRGNWPGYRIPAVAAGLGAIILAWLIGRHRDRTTAFFSMFLVSFSYVMILYSSEARGYAPLIFFCFLCFLVLESLLARPRWQAAALFSISAILGFTSHLTFVSFFVASFIWSCARMVRRKVPLPGILGWMAACYAAPLIYLAGLYFVDVRYLQIGGGTPIGVLPGYGAALAWTLGGPNVPSLQIITGIIAVYGLLAGLAIFFCERDDISIFFVAAIVVMPLSVPFLEPGTLHYVRYFIIAVAFLLLLLARLLAWLYEGGAVGRIVSGVCCLSFLVLNGWNVTRLIKYGRSHFSEAVQFMADRSDDESAITFGGDQDFRVHFVLAFYWREMMAGRNMFYYDHDQWPRAGPEWVIFNKESFMPPVPPRTRFTDKFGNAFELIRVFPTAPLSGIHWFVYRKTSQG